jgi:hypothetical protein
MGCVAETARQISHKDIWIVGGAITMQAAPSRCSEIFSRAGSAGLRHHAAHDLSKGQALVLDKIKSFADGVVKLRYFVSRLGRAARY